MNRRLFSILPAAVALLLTAPEAKAQTTPPAGFGMSVPVPLTVNGQPLTGTFKIKGFAVANQRATAFGTLTFTNAATGKSYVVGGVSAPVVLPTAAGRVGTTATCEILNLVLGPINLDLLGLVVTTNQIEINITAESGPGNLLGNLLCAIVNLLNPGNTPLQQLVNLLNTLLGLLG